MSVWDTIDSLLVEQKTHDSMEWEEKDTEWMQRRIGKRRAHRLRNQPVMVARTKPGHAYERLTKEHA